MPLPLQLTMFNMQHSAKRASLLEIVKSDSSLSLESDPPNLNPTPTTRRSSTQLETLENLYELIVFFEARSPIQFNSTFVDLNVRKNQQARTRS